MCVPVEATAPASKLLYCLWITSVAITERLNVYGGAQRARALVSSLLQCNVVVGSDTSVLCSSAEACHTSILCPNLSTLKVSLFLVVTFSERPTRFMFTDFEIDGRFGHSAAL